VCVRCVCVRVGRGVVMRAIRLGIKLFKILSYSPSYGE
jgi:hypothetical protein